MRSKITLGNFINGELTGIGSSSKTSSAAPATVPFSSALTRRLYQ